MPIPPPASVQLPVVGTAEQLPFALHWPTVQSVSGQLSSLTHCTQLGLFCKPSQKPA
jgi:hypothetical protein